MEKAQHDIRITEIVSPSMFFYFSLDSENLNLIKSQENELQKYFQLNKPEKGYQPKTGDICGFYHNASKKWIKIEIVSIVNRSGIDIALFWCCDYGVSMCTDNFARLSAIPHALRINHHLIQAGSLNVLPLPGKPKWSTKSIQTMKNLVESAKALTFKCSESASKINVGDIEISNEQGFKFSLFERLIASDNAFLSSQEELLDAIEVDKSLRDRWSFSTRKDAIVEKLDKNNFVLELPETDGPISTCLCNFESILKLLGKVKVPPPSISVKNNTNKLLNNSEAISTMTDKTSVSSVLREAKVVNKSENNQLLQQSPTLQTDQNSISSFVSTETSKLSILQPKKRDEQQLLPMGSEPCLIKDLRSVFIHGKYLRKPLEHINEAAFTKEVHEALHTMNFRSIFRLQSHSWPQVLEGRSVFIVNGENSGKTFSYLPAILSSLIFDEEGPTPSAQGPVGIIVVPSSRQVEIIYEYCRKITRNHQSLTSSLKIIKAFGKWNYEDKKVDLLNGCDLLITTPPCFSRLAKGNVIRIFNRNRIKHLIFDGLDAMQETFEEDLALIMKTCTKGPKEPEMNPQIIVTSTSWMEYMHSYLNLSCDPVVLIGSFVEAAVYAKCQIKVAKFSQDDKFSRLTKAMKKEVWRTNKTLVVLNNQSEISYFKTYLLKTRISVTAIDSQTRRENITKIAESWMQEEPEKMTLMLVTDEILPQCSFKTVQTLIHFSLPASWTTFSRRFATLSETLRQVADRKVSLKPYTLVLLDDENVVELPKLVHFLKIHKQLKVDISKDINDLVQLINEKREGMKCDESINGIMPICSNIFQFSACSQISKCKKRHVFVDTDKPVNIPCDGLIQFNLVGISNPSHFAIKINKYLPAGDKEWICCKKKIKKIDESLETLQKMMAEKSIIQVPVASGQMCAVFSPKYLKWCRCKVLEKEKTEKLQFKAIVHLIDYGQKQMVFSTDLKVLPDEIKLLDPMVSDLRIVNLVPFDRDETWDRETTAQLEKFFSEKTDGEFMISKIEFSIQNTVFTQNFETRTHDKVLNVDQIKYALRNDLLKKNFCLKDETVGENLKLLMKRANLYLPEKLSEMKVSKQPVKSKKENKGARMQWKQLAIGSRYRAQIKHFDNPNLFYIKIDDSNNNTLKQLMKPIENCNFLEPLAEVVDGNFCIISQKDEKAKRGIIIDVLADEKVQVFLLDAGESLKCSKNDVFKVPSELEDVIAFQAIQCRLVGLKPKYGAVNWTSRSLNAFRDFMKEVCRNKLIDLEVVAVSGKIHDVKLYLPESGEGLGELAVEYNLADAEADTEFPEVLSELDQSFNSSLDHEPVNVKSEQEKLLEMMQQNNTFEETDLKVVLREMLQVLEKAPTAQKIPLESYNQPNDELPSQKNQNKKTPLNGSEKPLSPLPPMMPSTMSYIHKHPKIEWRQRKEIIVLIVSAVDCVDYSLKIQDSSIEIYIKYESSFEFTVIHLYGIINVKSVSHEIAGRNIVIRSIKAISTEWPRLTDDDEHNRFIRYSDETIPTDMMSIEKIKSMKKPCPGGESDSSSDDEQVFGGLDEKGDVLVPID